MKKVLVIEDEFMEVQVAFEYVNDMYLNGDLEITSVIKSQEVDFSKLSDFGKEKSNGWLWHIEEN